MNKKQLYKEFKKRKKSGNFNIDKFVEHIVLLKLQRSNININSGLDPYILLKSTQLTLRELFNRGFIEYNYFISNNNSIQNKINKYIDNK